MPTTPNTVSFGSLIAPDIAAQQLQLQRKQQLVDFLRKQAIDPVEQQTVTGAGPARVVPISPLQGLAKMAAGYLSGKNQDTIDVKNLDLSRAMASRYAQILSGNSATPAADDNSAPTSSAADPASAPIDPNALAALSQGAAAGSVGPTLANAQRMDAMPPAADPTADNGSPAQPSLAPQQGPASQGPAPQMPAPLAPAQALTPQAPVQGAGPGNNNFNMANLLRGNVISQVGGDPAAAAYWDQFKATDGQKTDRYLGITPDQARTSELAKRLKAGYIPPTRLGNSGYVDPTRGFVPLPAPAPPGFINVPDPTNPSGYNAVQIGGGPAAVQAASKAKTAGEGEVIPYAGVDASGNPLPVTNRTAVATQGAGPVAPVLSPAGPPMAPAAVPLSPGNPPPGAGMVAPQSPVDRMAILQQQLAKTQQGVSDPTVNDADRQRLQRDAADIQGEMARMSTTNGRPNGLAPPQGAPGAVYAAPPLGTTSNADAAQKASAQTMHESYGKLQATNSSAQAALDALDKMMALAAKKNPVFTAGVLGTNQSAINPDAAEYEKQRANLIVQLAQQSGTNTTDAGRGLTGESVPDFGKPKTAIADGLGTLRNQITVQQLKANLLTPIYQSGDSKKYTTMENEFDQHIAPSMVPLLTMPAGPQRAALLQAAQKDPAVRAKLNWAAENGLLK